jgi:hypothetical protein
MFPKATLDVPKHVRAAYTAVASQPDTATAWVDAPLGEQLELAAANLLHQQPPFVLMSLRGRLYLRLQLAQPDADAIKQALNLFHAAMQSALRLTSAGRGDAPDFESTASTAWQNDIAPEDPPGGKRR